MADEPKTNIRDANLLGPFLGCRLVDATQQDDEDFAENHESRVFLHFDNGGTISFVISDDGFDIETIEPDEP